MKKLAIFLLFLPLVFNGQNPSDIVGSIGGTINASMFGGAVYSIPLDLPQGTGGLRPDLGIIYNSQGGNGLLGYGWNLSGISSVARTGSTLFHDGKKSAADFSADDRFLLDGQRLILVGTSGNDEEYKTENDEFSKIVFHKESGYHSKCEVWLENGNIIKYGYTGNSKLMASDGDNVIKWMVSSISDRNGNTIVYTYDNAGAGNDIYISQIQYTSNTQSNSRPEFSVNFTYTNNRPDSYNYCIAGNIIQSTKLLNSIEIKSSGMTIGTYSFSYDGNSDRQFSLLTEIYLSKGSAELNPTTIEWNVDDNDTQNNALSTVEIYKTIFDDMSFTGDFNGDGYTDLLTVPYKPTNGYSGDITLKVFLNKTNGLFQSTPDCTITAPDSLEWVHVVDLNGDGFDDVVLQTLKKHEINPSDFTYNSNLTVYESDHGTSFSNEYSINIGDQVLVKTGDFLGEGKNSLLVLKVTAFYENFYVLIDNPGIIHYTSDYSYDAINFNMFDTGVILADDFNGDGITELNVFSSDYRKNYSFANNNGVYSCTMTVYPFETSSYASLFSGDFNNDGKADIIFNYPGSSGKRVVLSTGTGFTDPILITNNHLSGIVFPAMHVYNYSLGNVANGTSYGISLSDFDGDGKSDIVFYNGNENPIFFRDFKLTSATTGEFSIEYSAHNEDIKFVNQYFTIGNFFGKDNASFIAFDPQSPTTTDDDILNIYSFPSAPSRFSVAAITNGLGIKTDIEYSYLMPGNGGFYHYSQRPYVNEVRPMPIPMMAMESYTEHIGGSNYKTSLNYSNALIHRTGRGFVGFENIVRKTAINNNTVKKESSRYELGTMGASAIALPSCDSIFICGNGAQTLSETNEYTFDDIRCNRNNLVVRPAMTAQKTKKYNPDNAGSLLYVEVVSYTYNYLGNNTYYNTYGCTEIAKGVNRRDCTSPSACEFQDTKSISYKSNNFSNWTINRVSEETVVLEATNKPSVTRKTKYEYSPTNPFLISSHTSIPSSNLVDPLTTKTEYVYDLYGNVTSETSSAPYGINGEQSLTTQYTYYHNRLVSGKIKDPNGLYYEEQYQYDIYDRITRYVGCNGLATTYTYNNGFSSTVTKTEPDNVITVEAIRWSAENELAPSNAVYYKRVTKTGKATVTTFYDIAGNVVRTATLSHNGTPVFVDTHYNERLLATQQSNPYFDGESPLFTVFQYDRFGRVTSTTTPNGITASNVYNGFITTTTTSANNMSRTTEQVTNPMGWVTRCIDASEAAVVYNYYADGKLASATTSNGTVTLELEYDNAGNRSMLNDPDYGETSFVYDAFGRLTEQETPKGDEFSYVYDRLGRLVQKQDHTGLTTTVYTYNEDMHKGTLASISHGRQNINYSYDSFDRPTSVAENIGGIVYTTGLEYDQASRVSGRTYPSGYKVLYEYYPNGAKKKVKDVRGNTLWQSIGINAQGQLLQATTGNGAVTTNTYDGLTSMLTGSVTSNGIQNYSYTYDKFGNMLSRADSISNKTEHFTYDILDRLRDINLDSITSSIKYDTYGRMISKEKDGDLVFSNASFDSHKPHAFSSVEAPDETFPKRYGIEYTAFDKVKKISLYRKSAVFTYGYDMQRIRMTITDTVTATTRTKTYVGGCEFEAKSGNTLTYTYLTCPYGVFAVVVTAGSENSVHYVYKDHLGSWTAITDSIGTVTDRASFDAWGNTDDVLRFDRGFTGHEHLQDFGFINMNGRMYDPLTSSFLSPDNYVQDPTTQQSFNRYAYCMYNPLKYVDPSGEQYLGWDPGLSYRIEQEMRAMVISFWHQCYDSAMASHIMTMAMATSLFSHGQHNAGNGSGNHGSPGGGSVEVKPIGNGKYEVVNGLNDGGNTVYVVDDQGNRTREILGYTLTPYTFYDKYGYVVDGSIIDMNDFSGQIFYDEINNNTPGEYYYAFGEENANGQNFGDYDFKAINSEGIDQDFLTQYYYRGMLFDYGNGIYISTARDIGNFVAGFVAGKNGVGFVVARFGFDWYQGGIEPKVSRRAQNKGYFWGLRCFFGF